MISEQKKHEKKQWSLLYVLVLCLAGFQFVTAIAIVFLVYFTTNHAILQQSEDLLDQHAEASVERVTNFFLPSLQVSEMLVQFVEGGVTDVDENDMLERVFFGALRTAPEISGVYFGRADGTFLYVYQADDGEFLTTKWIDDPGKGSFALVRDEGYRPVNRRSDPNDSYDPRDRSWYSAAAQSGRPTWTSAYTFYTSGRRGVTYAVPVFIGDRLVGVFGIDIEIWKMGQILEATGTSLKQTSSLTTASGDMLLHVSPGAARNYDTVSSMTGFGGEIVQTLFAEIGGAAGQSISRQFPAGSFAGQDDLILANIRSLADHGLPWLIATQASQNALTGGLIENQYRALWAAGILLAVLSLFAIPLANKIRRPVLAFAERSSDIVQDGKTLPPGAFQVPYAELATTGKTLETQVSMRRNFEIQYDRTFNVSQRGMAWIDPTTKQFLRVNKRLCAMLGRSEGVLLCSGLDTVLAGDKKRTLAQFQDAMLRDRDFTLEADFVAGGNLPVPMRMTAFLMRDYAGNPDHAFAIFDNNHESRQSAAQLENFKRDLDRIGRINLMGQFAAGLAHELNQPLGALVHDVDSAKFVLGEKDVDHAELADILTDIDSHAHRAGDIIRALRNMIERDDQIPRQFQLSELLDQTLAIMRPEALAYEVGFDVSLQDDYVIFGNRVQIAQVLVNLIRNAISALSTCEGYKRMIHLQAFEAEGGIVIVVHDNGPGFPDYVRPFAQFETTSRGGLGLGLSISKSLVEANKGVIVHVENTKRGARFEITLQGKALNSRDGTNERQTDGVRS